MVGTVNWRQMYGENAFRVARSVFQSDIEAAKKAKQINFAELEKRAKEYAKVGLQPARLLLVLPVAAGPPAATAGVPARGWRCCAQRARVLTTRKL